MMNAKKPKKLNSMAIIEYYVGILLEDREIFENWVFKLNHYNDWRYQVKILREFDDPDGYYTFLIQGYWDSYNQFVELSWKNGLVKSLTHHEE